MRQPVKYFYKKFKATTNVYVLGCIDPRLNGPGQWFLNAYYHGLMGRLFGFRPTFFLGGVPGPSVSECDFPDRAHTNQSCVLQAIETLGVQYVLLVAHEHCAGDTRDNESKIEGLRELAQSVNNKKPNVTIVTVFLHASVVGWKPEIIMGKENHIPVIQESYVTT